MLTTTLFLDFGAGIGFDAIGNQNDLNTSIGAFRDIDGVGLNSNGTGPNLVGRGAVFPGAPALTATSSLDLRPLSYDYNGDGNVNNNDLAALADDVIPIVQRALQPFDIDVIVAAASSLADVVTSLGNNDAATDGQNDAYSFIVDAVSDFFGGGSVGDNAAPGSTEGDITADGTRLFGIAAADDLFDLSGNNQDEVSLTFADTVMNSTNGVQGTAGFNENFAHRLAYTVLHEGLHTFALFHTENDNDFFPVDLTHDDEALLTSGDQIRSGSISRETNNILTRFDLQLEDREQGTNANRQNPYLLLANDPDIGLRDHNNNNIPDLAYVTGTGAHDRIRLSLVAGSTTIVNVNVDAFSDAARTTLIRNNTYTIDLTTDTDGEILIDSSIGNDLIEINSDIAASFRIRGMLGDDEVTLIGQDTGSVLLGFVFEGEDGDDIIRFNFDNGDALPQAGFDFAFAGGDGTDRTIVIDDGTATRPAFFVDSTVTTTYNAGAAPTITIVSAIADAADINVGNGIADSSTLPGDQITLRAAVQEANAAGQPAYVFLPSATTLLTLTGGETHTALVKDLDITGDVTIIGAGAGQSVIDGSALNDRIFEVRPNASLDLSRITLTGGDVGTSAGGAIFVNDGDLNLSEAALIGNSAGTGGAIRVSGAAADVTITRSVFANNSASGSGGAIYSGGSTPASLAIGSSIFAHNLASSSQNVRKENTTFNLGNNVVDSDDGFFSTFYSDHIDSSIINPADLLIVTNVSDRISATDGGLSLREAVVDANANNRTIWAPAWKHNLTLTGTGGTTQGDLDITGDVTIVGAGAGATVIDASGLGDRVFDVAANSSLDVSRVTLAGGMSASGGAVMVRSGGVLDLTDSAVANNSITFNGAAIRAIGADVTVRRSVFTNNASTLSNISGIYSNSGGSLTVGESIFALNTAVGATQYPNIRALGTTSAISLGNNVYDNLNVGSGTTNDFEFNEMNDQMLTGTSNFVVTSMVDRIDATDDNQVLSLREAVIAANNGGGTVWLPAWEHRLALTGVENGADATVNDLDITDDVTIVGAGAGLATISTVFATQSADTRIFEVNGANRLLDISRVTLAGGGVTSSGNAIMLKNGGTLNLTDSAVVNHRSTVNGVAIRSVSSDLTIRRSVFTNNESTESNIGAVYSSGTGSLTVGESIFALNAVEPLPGFQLYPNILVMGTGVTTVSEGNNLYDNLNSTSNNFSFNGPGDLLGTPDFVVTSVADTFDHADDNISLSLREAIDLANNSTSTDEIWLPAWNFVLTRDRATYGMGSETDMEVGFGDLDISESLVIRRAGAALASGVSAVKWRSGVNDRVFELLGDFDNDGFAGGQSASGSDFMVWQQQNGNGSIDPANWELYSADANDDGLVDGVDEAIWSANFGHELTLANVIGV